MNLIMKNYEVKALGDFLYELPLKGQATRMRSRFIEILHEQLALISKEREILLNDYAKKDEDGAPLTDTDENGNEGVILEDAYGFQVEMAKLMQEEFITDITSSKIEMIKVIKDVIYNVDMEFSGQEAERYNRFCEIIESVEPPE